MVSHKPTDVSLLFLSMQKLGI